MSLLVSTILYRPYVFAFLFIYLAAAILKIGPKKAVFFTLTAWATAYAAEYSSVRNGFPFGMYHYIQCTTEKELWICGVPFMDSLSFTFLSYASWTMARVFLSPSTGKGLSFKLDEGGAVKGRFSWDTVLLGALLFMLIDVVVDPLALRGDKWFLGKIYYYPQPGAYFGVTISNFVGWFVVGLFTLTYWGWIDRKFDDGYKPKAIRALDLMGPALYYIVLLFNLIMTFWIGEYQLGWAGVFIFLPVTALLVLKLSKRAV